MTLALWVLTARDAADRGAEIRTVPVPSRLSGRRNLESHGRKHRKWRALQHPRPCARQRRRTLVEDVLASGAGVNAKAKVRLVQGSTSWCESSTRTIALHVPEQRRPHRFSSSLPGRFTLIGTRSRLRGRPGKVKASSEEIKYLCDSVSEYLAKPVKPEDVVWTYAGRSTAL